MTSQQVVEKELKEAFDKFYDSVYSGKVEVPDTLIENYEKSIMALAPHFHQTNFNKVKAIIGKTKKQLTNSDINAMLKVLLNTPLEKLYGNIDYAVSEHIKLEKFTLAFNGTVNDFQVELQQKKTVLESLSGANQNRSRLSIIN